MNAGLSLSLRTLNLGVRTSAEAELGNGQREGKGWERRHSSGRWERRGGKQRMREWYTLEGERAVPRPYLEGVPAFQNPAWYHMSALRPDESEEKDQGMPPPL